MAPAGPIQFAPPLESQRGASLRPRQTALRALPQRRPVAPFLDWRVAGHRDGGDFTASRKPAESSPMSESITIGAAPHLIDPTLGSAEDPFVSRKWPPHRGGIVRPHTSAGGGSAFSGRYRPVQPHLVLTYPIPSSRRRRCRFKPKTEFYAAFPFH